MPNVADIPCDWPGNMGVPITFLESHNPDQFQIVGLGEGIALFGFLIALFLFTKI